MPAVATRSMIRREIGDDRVCLLTFDRPESAANIFDAATMSELSEHVDVIEGDQSLRGLIPAWGGSTRLPRLIGEDNAAEVILKGKLYSASEALKIGLVDEVVTREKLLDAARRLIGKGKRPPAKISRSKGKTPVPSDPKSARARALGVITTGGANPIDESLKLELDAIVDLGKTESTQNLIRNFFLAEKYKKGTSKT